MKNPKAKGNAYEIKICRRLSKWVIGKERPLLYWKVGSSGAQATLTRDAHSKLLGDMVCIDRRGAFLTETVVIELKDVKTTNILDFISEKRSDNIRVWWEKVQKQAKDGGRIPWLIYHRSNTRLDYLVCSGEDLCKLEQYVGLYRKSVSIQGEYRVVILELEYFLKRTQPWDFAWAFLGEDRMNEVKRNYLG